MPAAPVSRIRVAGAGDNLRLVVAPTSFLHEFRKDIKPIAIFYGVQTTVPLAAVAYYGLTNRTGRVESWIATAVMYGLLFVFIGLIVAVIGWFSSARQSELELVRGRLTIRYGTRGKFIERTFDPARVAKVHLPFRSNWIELRDDENVVEGRFFVPRLEERAGVAELIRSKLQSACPERVAGSYDRLRRGSAGQGVKWGNGAEAGACGVRRP